MDERARYRLSALARHLQLDQASSSLATQETKSDSKVRPPFPRPLSLLDQLLSPPLRLSSPPSFSTYHLRRPILRLAPILDIFRTGNVGGCESGVFRAYILLQHLFVRLFASLFDSRMLFDGRIGASLLLGLGNGSTAEKWVEILLRAV